MSLGLSGFRALPASEASAILQGLLYDSRTHFSARVSRQTYQGSHADFAAIILAGAILNMGKDKNAKRVELPGPFFGYKSEAQQAAQVDPQERKRLENRLRQYSSIPD